tara:strand:- start:39 stop:605 length:567 start_codon:yes stop_codon:yes gene_type:complete
MSSILKVDQLQDSGGNNLVTSNGSGVITAAGFGKVGQVVQTVYKSFLSLTLNNTYSQITGLNTNITPSSTSSKILYKVSVSNSVNNVAPYTGFRITEGGTAISDAYGGVGGNRKQVSFSAGHLRNSSSAIEQNSFEYLHSPSSTSTLTYGLQVTAYNNREIRINQTVVDDANSGHTAVSTLTLMEILP